MRNGWVRYGGLTLGALVLMARIAEARDPVVPPAPPFPNPSVEKPVSPYALSYSDELARRLGISRGHMDVFSVAPSRDNSVFPTVKGGVDRNGAGIKLQWQLPK